MNNDTPMIYPEVITQMSENEMNLLMNELVVLLQNQDARICISQEKGFRYLLRVLTGKQKKLKDQIWIDQRDINRIGQQIQSLLWKKIVNLDDDIVSLQAQINYLQAIARLQGILLSRILERFPDIDAEPIENDIEQMHDEIELLQRRVEENSTEQPVPSPVPTITLNEDERIKKQIVALAEEKIHSADDFDLFITKSQFSHSGGGHRNPNHEKTWDTVFTMNGWVIQRMWSIPNHYRIMEPPVKGKKYHVIRAWTTHPEEIIQWLTVFQG